MESNYYINLYEPLKKIHEFYINLSNKTDSKSINKIKLLNLFINNIINIFNNESVEPLNSMISNELLILNKEIINLNETIDELRENYWDLKQKLIKLKNKN